MKIIFWISAVIQLIAACYLLVGFVNIYFKNYNGGPQSSSGSIVYFLLLAVGILAGGFYCYFTGRIGLAAAIMGIPLALLLVYLFVMLILPALMGERMN